MLIKVFFIFINLVLLNFLIYNGGKSLYVNGIIGIMLVSINIFEKGFYKFMNTNEISGKRQMEFLAEFDYIREAGTVGEEKAATIIQETLNSFGVENHLEEFCFETFQVKKAKLTITEPYAKEYIVTGYGRCANTDENGRNESFLYVENADEISLANARGKIVMVNDPVRKELYQKLVKAGVAGFISIAGSPLDEA